MKSVNRILLFLIILISFSNSSFSQDSDSSSSFEITREELREIVEESVAMKIRPLQREISELKDETRIHDIMGGVGVIMGIGGLIFYFAGKKKEAEDQPQ